MPVIDRRRLLAMIAATTTMPASAAGIGRGGAEPVPVIDGNLVMPTDTEKPLDAATTALIRSARLTAFKLTLGGSGNQSGAQTDAEIADLRASIALNPALLMQIRTPDDLTTAAETQRTGIIFSFEAAEMLEGRVEAIDHFRDAGVLVMGLSYNRVTPFASGVLAARSTGLTELGRAAVRRMNERGVTLDLSHSDEPSSMAALSASTRPPVISHAGCAAVQPHPRNKSDALLRALADKGGVIGIYELSFLVPPPRQPGMNDYMTHLSHALNVCGEDHVAIGTDGSITPFNTSAENMAIWDAEIARRRTTGVGAPGEGPPPFVIGLNRPDRSFVIGDALRKKGYSGAVVDKVLGGNLARVFRETWIA